MQNLHHANGRTGCSHHNVITRSRQSKVKVKTRYPDFWWVPPNVTDW